MTGILTLCLYVSNAFLAFWTNKFSSVSSLKEITYACGTHDVVTGTSIFGTSCNVIDNGPPPD